MQVSLRRWILIGLLAYLLFAIYALPARALLNFVGGETVSTSNVSGSAWRGQAETLTAGSFSVRDVSWTINPLSLFTLKAGGSVKAKVPGGPVEADVYRSFLGSDVVARRVKAVLNIGELTQAIGKQSLFNGRIGLNLESVTWDGTQIADGVGDVTLVELTDIFSNTPIGTFEIKFNGIVDNSVTGVITEFNAPFEFDGTLKLGAARSYLFDGLVQPTADTPKSIIDSLPSLGATRDSQGNYSITKSGTY